MKEQQKREFGKRIDKRIQGRVQEYKMNGVWTRMNRRREGNADGSGEIEWWKGGKMWYKINGEIKSIQEIGRLAKVGKEDSK